MEAQQILQEVSYAIKEGALSNNLPSSPCCVYINFTTMEDRKITVRLSSRGFEVQCSVTVGLW